MSHEDGIITRDDILYRTSLIAANEAFAKAMQSAIKRGRETATPGTFVDTRPFVGRLIRGEPPFSMLGSSAAMCAERGAVGDDRMAVQR